ncbi:MAG: hypothetical protein HY059_20180 [Proteobacteria bacterium]|nr:hypothetical protein [Pseudomonadota bacterium]
MLTVPIVAISLVIAVGSGCAVGTGPRWEDPYASTRKAFDGLKFEPRYEPEPAPSRYVRDPIWPNLCVLHTEPKKRGKVPECRY